LQNFVFECSGYFRQDLLNFGIIALWLHITDDKIKILEVKANEIRKSIIESLVEAKSGHTAGPTPNGRYFHSVLFSYFKTRSKEPTWMIVIVLVLSNGHILPSTLRFNGACRIFSVEELKTLRKLGSRYKGIPHRDGCRCLRQVQVHLDRGFRSSWNADC